MWALVACREGRGGEGRGEEERSGMGRRGKGREGEECGGEGRGGKEPVTGQQSQRGVCNLHYMLRTYVCETAYYYTWQQPTCVNANALNSAQ